MGVGRRAILQLCAVARPEVSDGQPAAGLRSLVVGFEGAHRYGRAFVLTMHPYIIGRPGRLLMLERLIEHIKDLPQRPVLPRNRRGKSVDHRYLSLFDQSPCLYPEERRTVRLYVVESLRLRPCADAYLELYLVIVFVRLHHVVAGIDDHAEIVTALLGLPCEAHICGFVPPQESQSSHCYAAGLTRQRIG